MTMLDHPDGFHREGREGREASEHSCRKHEFLSCCDDIGVFAEDGDQPDQEACDNVGDEGRVGEFGDRGESGHPAGDRIAEAASDKSADTDG